MGQSNFSVMFFKHHIPMPRDIWLVGVCGYKCVTFHETKLKSNAASQASECLTVCGNINARSYWSPQSWTDTEVADKPASEPLYGSTNKKFHVDTVYQKISSPCPDPFLIGLQFILLKFALSQLCFVIGNTYM